MKFLLFYRLAFILIVVVISPFVVKAGGDSHLDKSVGQESVEVISSLFQDSTAARQKPESKPQEKPEQPSQDVRDERIREGQRREIKQVPRSMPKLKPQAVSEGIKIGRPPMKIPKRRIGG